MHHFFVGADDITRDTVELRGEEARHAVRVLRVRPGEWISVADGSGKVLEGVVTGVGATVTVDVRKERMVAPITPAVTLYQSIAKGERMDLLVQKAVEIGVRRVVPSITEHTVVRWDESKRAKARDRWRDIARAAAKQSRSPWLTEIDDVQDGLSFTNAGACRIGLEASAQPRLRAVLPSETPDTVSLIVGPEGGLSGHELDEIVSAGGVLASLGDRVLRTETAGPIAAALVLFVYGSLG